MFAPGKTTPNALALGSAAAPGLVLVIKLMLVATRYKTRYRWLHGGYTEKLEHQKEKARYLLNSRLSISDKALSGGS